MNEPELVILDEPMSGLDPLGRRDVRALILRLRRSWVHGVFQLARPERRRNAVQQVAILAKGALVASGKLSEMLAFKVRGWELVVADTPDALVAALGARVTRAIHIGEGRFFWSFPHPARTDGGRVDRSGRQARVTQSAPGDARAFLHPARGGADVTSLGWIAVNGFRESVRDKVLYNLVVFAILLMGSSLVLGQLTAGQGLKIIKDLGLSAMSVFGLFIAVFIGIGLVFKEVERRSIYNLLSKPIRRYEVVVGKYAGLVLTLTINIVIMTVALYAVLAYVAWGQNEFARQAREAPALDPALLKAIALLLVQLMIVTAIALFFSTFSTPILSAALTFGMYAWPDTSAPIFATSIRLSTRGSRKRSREVVLHPAEPGALRCHGAGGARAPGHRRIHGGDDRLRRRVSPSCSWPAGPSSRREFK